MALPALGPALGGGGQAQAQVPTLPASTTTTAPPRTTTTPPTEPEYHPPPPTTAAPPTTAPPEPAAESPAPGADPGTAADPGPAAGDPSADSPGAAAPAGGGQPPNPAGRGPGPPGALGGAAAPGEVAPGEVPPEARQAMNAVRRSPANSTRRLLAALAPLQELGMTEQEAIAIGFGRFPVGGYATFSHDWLFPRFTPTFHLHHGTDIFATTGTPVRSPADGTLRLAQGGSGGLAAYVYQPDGTYFYMAHLDAFVPGQRPGQQVKVGDVVGYVGDSGNAEGGTPHVHFELHPAPTREIVTGKGKSRKVTRVVRPVPVGSVLPPADPKATLDQWLAEALAGAEDLVASVESRSRALLATGITRRSGDGRSTGFPLPVAPPRSQLLWASSVNPAGGAVRLAEAEAMLAAHHFDWSRSARRQQALLQEQAAAVAWAEAVLAPLTPEALLSSSSTDE